MKKFKLVLADHDGTIVNDDREISQRTVDAIEALHRDGYLFGMASGRTVEDVGQYPKRWGLSFDFDVIIGLGGCQFWDGVNHKLYEENFLPKESIKEIYELMHPLGVPASMTVKDRYIIERLTEQEKESIERNHGISRYVVNDPSEFWQEDAPKIMFRLPEEKMEEVEAYVAAHPSDKFRGFKTQPIIFEFSHIDAKKSNGLKKIEELYGIHPEEVIAFGDTTNDNDLLEACYGVCMANGTADTKAISKEITEYGNNDDGFARYVEKYLL